MDVGPEAWLLTREGILSLRGEPVRDVPFGDADVVAGASRGGATSVVVDEREVWTNARGVWRRDATADLDVYSLARTADGKVLVGTESARLAVVASGALRFLPAFDGVPERSEWFTPYGAPPELRSLAIGADGTIYADVHVGWIVRSRDGGATWKSLVEGLDQDVHMVAAHPTRAGTVFAATADGFHLSHDRGDTWHRRPSGMPYLYQRAVAVFPDRDVYLASTARHNGGAGAMLFRSEDEGVRWERVAGLPETLNRNIDTWQVAALRGGRGLAVVDDDTLYGSEDGGRTWRPLRPDLPAVNAILPVEPKG